MFQKLLIYKEEQGTLRFPSEDQCAATGDDELIALQKWVKSQVLSFRYGKKRDPEIVKRLLDIGFDFEVSSVFCIVLFLYYSLDSFLRTWSHLFSHHAMPCRLKTIHVFEEMVWPSRES